MLVHNAEVTGSLKINNILFNSGSFSGSFRGDGSQLTGVAGATTASYVEYSNVANKPALVSGSSQITYSGLSGVPAGIVSGSSQVTYSGLTGIPVGIVSGSSQVTYSGLTGVPSGIVSGSAQITGFGIFATTGSNQFNGSQAITGSLTVTGQVVAQTLNVQQVTSSIVYSSGSNIFGNSLGNTQQFTGSVSVTGSLTVNGAGTFSSAVTSNSFISDGTANEGVIRIERDTVSTNTVIGALNFTNNNGATVYGRVRGGRNSAGDGYVSLGTGVGENLYALEGGNVGIGTNSPNYLLHIAAGAANPQLQFTSTGTGSTISDGFHIGVNNSTLNAFLLQKENAALQFLTNDTERMRLDASGSLGLGVTPSAWNSAYKAFQFGTTGALFGESGDAANYFTTNTFVDSVGFKYITSDWALGYFQENGVHSWRTAASGTAGNAITFTQAMTLDTSGRLGIGNTSMSSFDSYGNQLVVGNGSTNQGITIYASTSTESSLYFADGTGAASYRGYIYYRHSNDSMFFGTSAATALTISSTGAATFTSTVTATGNVRSINTGVDGTFADAFVGVYNVNNNEQNAIQTSVSSAANVSGFRFQASNGGGSAGRTTVVDFLRDRQLFYTNVGIGTTNPTYRTEVALSISAYWNGTTFTGGNPTALSINNTTNGGYDPVLLLQQTDSGGTTKLTGGIGLVGTGPWTAGDNATQISDMYFLVRNSSGGISERMRIKSSGNVGIGTNSPSEKLEVQDGYLSTYHNINANDAGYGIQFYTNGGGSKNSLAYIGLSQVGTARSGNLLFQTSNAGAPSTKMIITSGGSVGIGIDTPSRKLQVREAGTSTSGDVVAVRNDNVTSGAFINFIAGGNNAPSIGAKGNDLVFTADGYAGAERMRILTGGGITFNGDTAAANALDDYEEGTWTPVIGGTGGQSGQSYGGQTGYYTKIGRQVTVTFRVLLSNKGTITGNVAIKGLPFTIDGSGVSHGAGVTYFEGLATSWSSIFLMATGGETYATIDGIKSAATLTTRATTSDIGNTTQFNGSMTYFV